MITVIRKPVAFLANGNINIVNSSQFNRLIPSANSAPTPVFHDPPSYKTALNYFKRLLPTLKPLERAVLKTKKLIPRISLFY
jgi:16S rRNA G966 N2-methylase RsmD